MRSEYQWGCLFGPKKDMKKTCVHQKTKVTKSIRTARETMNSYSSPENSQEKGAKRQWTVIAHQKTARKKEQKSTNYFSFFFSFYASINFIQNHSPSGQSLRAKTLPSGQNKESKAPPRYIKLENFTNVSVNSDTIFETKSCVVRTFQQIKRFSMRRLDY